MVVCIWITCGKQLEEVFVTPCQAAILIPWQPCLEAAVANEAKDGNAFPCRKASWDGPFDKIELLTRP